MTRTTEILDVIEGMFPDARCELLYQTNFQLAVSVILSAQTTDRAVNEATPALFERFPDALSMSKSTLDEIEPYIQRIGLYHNKARHILAFSKALVTDHGGEVPSSYEELVKLPGIGSKTANVIQGVGFNIPSLAVDTHVHRVSLRLKLVPKGSDVGVTEATLKRKIPRERWIVAHHAILFFGRYHCKSQKPDCDRCPLKDQCGYYQEKTRKR